MKKVYVGMSTDVVHHGHIKIIEAARKLGEVTVGILTDKAIANFKRVPLLSYEQRKKIIENIKGVKNVIPQETLDYVPNLKKLKPDYVVHGTDWRKGIQKKIRSKVIEVLKGYGGRLVEIEYTKDAPTIEFIGQPAQKEYIGLDSISNLKKILNKHKPKNIFLVTGKKSYTICGAKPILDIILKNYKAVHFYDFQTNPKLSDIVKGIGIFKKNNCDFVIAVGGGSVIDMAKSINIFAANPIKPADFFNLKKSLKLKGKTLVAIPTTSGTGSEATSFAVVYLGKDKHSVESYNMLPDYAIVDPQFTISLPKNITASTSMDAFSQAIESYWSNNSTDESKIYSKEAIKLIFQNLRNFVNKPSEKSRLEMAKAAHLAGKAINISKTTACHAISYPITSYFNVPHGHAVALTLAQMLVYNSQVTEKDILDGRGVDYVKGVIREIVALLESKDAEEAGKKINSFMKEIGLATRLGELGIKTDMDIEIIIKNGFNPYRVKNNPRELTESALRRILNDIK